MQKTTDMRSFEKKTLQGHYLLQKYLGEGNFGAVYKAEQLFLGVPVRQVAVKLSKHTHLNAHTARAIFADAFLLAHILQEMKDAEARLHLVHLYDMGIAPEEENRGFIVMEYIEGTTLAEQFASFQRMPASILVNWMLQTCCALRGLHTLEPPILHRDLKPDNILLGRDQILRIVDFGLAARLMHRGFAHGVVGALSYMAPEIRLGESIPASDVFSIGVILYEGLTGQHPFAHLLASLDTPEENVVSWIYRKMSTYRPDPPSCLNNTVPSILDDIILRCLEFYPDRRYCSAYELLNDLSRVYEILQSQ